MYSTIWPASPGAIIGYRRNGVPIRLIAGGSGEGDGTGGESGEPAAGDQDGRQDGGGEGNAEAGREQDGGSAGAGSEDAGRTDRTIAAIREDFKTERGKRQAAEKELAAVKKAQADLQTAIEADKAEQARRMDALAIALGLKSGDEPPDPEKLAAELKAAQEKAQAEISQRDASIRQSQVELAILRTAGRNGANGDALLDSRSFMAKVSGLDPASESFGEDLADAIKAAVENGPQYKAVGAPPADAQQKGSAPPERKPPAPARSAAQHTAPGGNRQWTLADVDAATPSELAAAMQQGLLVDLGHAPSKSKR